MAESLEARNKVLVLEAFDTLFNRRDYAAAVRLLSPRYVQHGAHGAPHREGLIELIKSLPPTLRYELDTIAAYGDCVVVQGKFSGVGQQRNGIASDFIRIEDGVLAESWNVTRTKA
jgi:predicted SnoaL-like aldol condensation-catalyzing enzyme